MVSYIAKPPPGTPFNRADPLSKSMIGAWPFNLGLRSAFRNMTTGLGDVSASGFSLGSGVYGRSIKGNGSNSYGAIPDIANFGDFTVAFACTSYGLGATDEPIVYSDNYPTSPRNGFGLKGGYGGTVNGIFEAYVAGTGGASPFAWAEGDPAVFHLIRSGTSVFLYKNGLNVGNVSVGTGTFTAQNIRVLCHYYGGANQEFARSTIEWLTIHNKALTDKEIQRYISNPFWWLERRRNIGLYKASTSSSQTISASVLTQSVSVVVPTLSVGAVSISAPVVTESESLVNPSLSEGAVSISASIIQESEILVRPSVNSQTSVSVAAITESESLVNPTLSEGAISVPVSLIPETVSVQAVTLSEGGVSIPVTVIVESVTIVNPTVTYVTAIAVSTISETVALVNPTLVAIASIAVSAIVESELVQAVTLTVGAYSVTPPIVAETITLAAVSVTGPGQIPVSAIVESITLQGPSLSSGGVSVSASVIVETEALTTPSVSVGSASVQPSTITEQESLVVPAITEGSNSISPSVILESVSLAVPTLSQVTSIVPTAITEQVGLIDPTLTGSAISISVSVITETLILNTPQLINLSILIDVSGPVDVSAWGVFTVTPIGPISVRP